METLVLLFLLFYTGAVSLAIVAGIIFLILCLKEEKKASKRFPPLDF